MSTATMEFSDATKKLGDEIMGLSLKEAKSLSDYLKDVHGIEPAAGGGVMMAMPAGGGGGGGGEAAAEKTEFSVVLEGAGENFMLGGADPAIPNLVPSDIEFRRNHCFKPLTWRIGDPSYAGTRWSVKNLFELKNAQRALVDGEEQPVDGIAARPRPLAADAVAAVAEFVLGSLEEDLLPARRIAAEAAQIRIGRVGMRLVELDHRLAERDDRRGRGRGISQGRSSLRRYGCCLSN